MGSGTVGRRAGRVSALRAVAFERGLDAWRVEAAELDQLQDVAAVFQGRTNGSVGTAVVLEPDEAIFLFLPRVHLAVVQGERRPTASAAGSLVADARRIAMYAPGTFAKPRGVRVVRSGTLTVTDRRIVFDSANRSDTWTFAQLSAIEHHADQPCSTLRLTATYDDASAPLALVYPPATAVQVRFHLTLASSRWDGTDDQLTAELDGALLAQWLTEPAEPSIESATTRPKRTRTAANSC